MAQDWRTPNGLRIFGGMATRGLLTLPQVASRLHVSESTDRNRIERVSFPPFESGTARWLRSAWTRTSSSFGFSRLLRRSHPVVRHRREAYPRIFPRVDPPRIGASP